MTVTAQLEQTNIVQLELGTPRGRPGPSLGEPGLCILRSKGVFMSTALSLLSLSDSGIPRPASQNPAAGTRELNKMS